MKKKSFIVLSLMLAFIFVLTSCGGTKPKNTQNTTNDQTEKKINVTETMKCTNPEKLPATAKNRNDMIIVGTHEMEGKFLPQYSNTVYDSWVTSLVFDGLILNDDKGNPIGLLADKWEISPDGKTYTFHIKKGVKYTNGEELTADDVKFSYQVIADPKYDGTRSDAVSNLVGYKEYNKGNATEVSGIKVIDKYTISFTEKQIKASALISDFGYGITPKSVYNFEKGSIEQFKAKFLKPIGTGAYKFITYKPGAEVDYEANSDYFRGAPKVKNLVMKVTTAQTAIQQLKAGETDVDIIAAKPENISMLKDSGFLDLNLYPDNGYGYIGFNCRIDMFKDKKVRQALCYGLNRKGFVDTYYKGYAQVCNVPVSIVSWAYPDKVDNYEYNPEKAKQLLDEAGWKMGNDGFRYKDKKKFTIRWITYTGSKYMETLIPIVKENWKKIGVDVVPELMDFGTLCTKIYDKQQFEMFNMSWSLSIDPDPSGIFSVKQAVIGGSDAGGWTTPESEKLMEEGLATTDQAKRKEIYNKWFEVVNNELPYIFLDQSKFMYAVSSRVKGIEVGPYRDWTYDMYKAEIAK